MLTNSFSPTVRPRSVMAATVSPLIAWKVFVRPLTSILAMSPRRVGVVDVRRHRHVLLEEAQLVEARQRVLKVLGHDPGIDAAIDVLPGEVELLEHGLGHLVSGRDHLDDRFAVLRPVDVRQQGAVYLETPPEGDGRVPQAV